MEKQDFEPNWAVLVGCVVALLGFVYMQMWMDISFEVEKAQAAKEYRP